MERREPRGDGRVVSLWGPLAPGAAERIVEGLRYRYGLGQAYRVRVRGVGGGRWEIEDGQGRREVVSAMGAKGVERWYLDRYGVVIAERLETSEG